MKNIDGYKLINPEGTEIARGTESQCLVALQKNQPSSCDRALKVEGWSIVPYLNKKKDHAFRKDVYLVGIDSEGVRYWLEEHTWDCEWYWGKGYIETYERNRAPSKSKDIESHTHYSSILKRADGSKAYHLNDKILAITVLTDDEAWRVAELMERVDILAEYASLRHIGGANITSLEDMEKMKDENEHARINLEIKGLLDIVISIFNPTK